MKLFDRMPLVFVIGLILSTSVMAHKGATGIIKERMDGMEELKSAMKVLTPMARGKIPFDANSAKQKAEVLVSHSGTNMTKLFPEGSLDKPSIAKPNIWRDWAKFEALAMDLEMAAQAIVDDPEKITEPANFKAISSTCSGCHKPFRFKK